MAQTNTVNNIVTRLLTLDPYRIVLFGSHAMDREHLESDVDLLVILDSEIISQTYEERIDKKISARHCIEEINKEIPIDLLVYTRAEYEYLLHQGVSFLNEIEKSGKTVYEKTG
ncbi:MAG: nucleotidyltransferase domain-containing protein [Gemmatimonadetes bacterium]|nr:nucleotidyltransferase domain-containing protein [Gemmatimonadota bacterium]